MSNKLKLARVLFSLPHHGVKPGDILEATADLIEQLAKDGSIDPHRDAVDYARTQGATTVRSAIELAAAARAKRADDLRVQIAEAQALLDKPEQDEPTRTALQRRLADLHAELAASI